MKRRIITSSLIILFVLIVCFFAIYSFMIVYCKETNDYSKDIIGSWSCSQYFLDGQIYSVNKTSTSKIVIDDEKIEAQQLDILGFTSLKYQMTSGTMAKLLLDDGSAQNIIFDFNSHGELKINFKEKNIILVLRNEEK